MGCCEITLRQRETDVTHARHKYQDAMEENGRLEARIQAFVSTAESEHGLFQGEVRRREEAIQKLKAQQQVLQETISKQEEKVPYYASIQ